MLKRDFERGATWHQWDLHVHTPASFHWDGEKFSDGMDKDAKRRLIDDMINAMNEADPEVFAIMDYWTFDGWFALQQRLAEGNSPRLNKKVFPGIELRLSAPTEKRLNAHVVFSDDISDQHLRDFLSRLQIERIDRPISKQAMIDLARSSAEDIIRKKGHRTDVVKQDADEALLAGYKLAEINTESYKEAIACVPNKFAIGFMPFDTSDGLSCIKWQEHYSYFLGLFEASPIFESRNTELRSAFLCEETESNASWIDNFKHGLKGIPRLVVAGSDAHRFVGVSGDNDKRGYGDFPSGMKTWIKADPTFEGLRQAIREPSKRSFIGGRPPKLKAVASNKTSFIESVEVKKSGTKKNFDKWMVECDIPLNPNLTAIIGNKGSGKSALADIVATLGNSRQWKHFSFLKKKRFLGRSGSPADQFTGTLTWLDASTETRLLNEMPSEEKAELVRYIPQNYFEDLCNEHASGSSNVFERELRSVIFSHIDENIRLGALDFDQLVEQQEVSLRNKLSEHRKELASINDNIVRIEEQLQPIEQKKLEEQLKLKNRQVEEHESLKPEPVSEPGEKMSPEQKEASDELSSVNKCIEQAEAAISDASSKSVVFAKKRKAISNVQEQLRLLRRAFTQAKVDLSDDLTLLEIPFQDLVIFDLHSEPLENMESKVLSNQEELQEAHQQHSEELEELSAKHKKLTENIGEPQRRFDQYQRQLKTWKEELNNLVGSSSTPDTQVGLKTRIIQIEELPHRLQTLEDNRLEVMGEIYSALEKQRKSRESLFKPVQELVENNKLIREDYRLMFQATLSVSSDSISTRLFDLVKQTSGEFRGHDEAFSTIKKMCDIHDLSSKDGVETFVTELVSKIRNASGTTDSKNYGIFDVLRKGKSAADVYNLIFGLMFLDSRYSLLFQDAEIEQLSPGQRGALLLIFYLLVDRGANPIILDQPEENLDNETVYRLLVPVLTEAKRTRQILMVTHNPNLAVVCDAEQIIYAIFDRTDGFRISYKTGAIESAEINEHVVTVLEGTKPAFDNRSGKYLA